MAAGGSPSTLPKLPWPSTKRVAQGEVLGHAHQGIVDGGVAVRVVLLEHLTHDTGALAVRGVVAQAHRCMA